MGAVGGPGQRRVQIVAGHPGGDDRVGGAAADAGLADGHALHGGMGVGVTQAHPTRFDVPGGDDPGDAAGDFGGGHRPVGVDLLHFPAVVVPDEVGPAQGQGPLVLLGDDHIAGRHRFPVGQLRFGAGVADLDGEAGGAGLRVEGGDHGQGGGDHDRVGAGGDVGGPCGEHLPGGGVRGDRLDALLVGPVPDDAGVTGAQRQ